jgi:hypothetical protein
MISWPVVDTLLEIDAAQNVEIRRLGDESDPASRRVITGIPERTVSQRQTRRDADPRSLGEASGQAPRWISVPSATKR